MINSVTIAGYLGSQPELMFVGEDQVEVCNMSIAVQTGKDKTLWVKVTAWKKTAVFCADYLKAGSFIVVSGRLDNEVWQDADGSKKQQMKVIAEAVQSPKTK
ncbi:single-stranded DNA-binding protein [Geminocystis sp. NIES-3709]|uniref:single-stranded DNA-binding protein n=1 Tax=Geminocystis sp. NIES-3709 TaxID=1617448 RepID=UPI0005FC981F|nr:single-stranded DNA-binding protein [Geminocystis sp. NIES-3709]BAQ67093.1 single-stranded DNA-binding protein [Geminocystis sp. NIES-3709]